jgi:hypothetical protein
VLVVGLIAAMAVYVAFKYVQRQRLLRRLRVARIDPQELWELIQSGMRSPSSTSTFARRETAPYTIPGALRMSPDEVAQRHRELPAIGFDPLLLLTQRGQQRPGGAPPRKTVSRRSGHSPAALKAGENETSPATARSCPG